MYKKKFWVKKIKKNKQKTGDILIVDTPKHTVQTAREKNTKKENNNNKKHGKSLIMII